MGSVALKLIRQASLSVLMLRSHGEMLAGPQPGYERPRGTVVPLDGPVHAKAALESTAALVHALATMHLLAVVEVDEEAEDESARGKRERRLARARRYPAHAVEEIHAGLAALQAAGLQLELTWSVHTGSDGAQNHS
uniref:UspA domain-containing protein n=1 Tax=Thermogemmatispora argillosa TaxID=2045280 RepID=A0A455SX40_9CHLR|nr:hypothetical protein KTA_02870 [Thermogemmatispora argillosa]